MKEVFKTIKGYEGYYEVSNLGRVKSVSRTIKKSDSTTQTFPNRILKLNLRTSGYLGIGLTINGIEKKKPIAVLVYEAFKGDIKDGYVIDHIDHNPINNNINNLQQLTHRENTSKDKWRKKRSSKYTGVSWDKQKRKWLAQIYYNRKSIFLGYFNSEIKAAESYKYFLKYEKRKTQK